MQKIINEKHKLVFWKKRNIKNSSFLILALMPHGIPSMILYTRRDLLHLIENVFTLTPPSAYLTLTLILKRNYVFGLTKWRHFSIKCTDTYSKSSVNTRNKLRSKTKNPFTKSKG